LTSESDQILHGDPCREGKSFEGQPLYPRDEAIQGLICICSFNAHLQPLANCFENYCICGCIHLYRGWLE